MSQRSKYQIMTQAAEIVEMGGRAWQVRPLVIRRQRRFEQHLFGRLRQMSAEWKTLNMQDTSSFGDLFLTIEKMLAEDLLELVKLAIPEFDKVCEEDYAWVLDNVTSPELQVALIEAVVLNFPFLRTITKLIDLGIMTQTLANSSPEPTISSSQNTPDIPSQKSNVS